MIRQYRAGLLVLSLVGAACGATAPTVELSSPRLSESAEEPPSPTVTVQPADPVPTASATPTEVPQPGLQLDLGFGSAPAAGLITVTDVPVAVLGQVNGQSIVRTPCGASDFISGGTELSEVEVVLDPGHGGPIDTGAVGPNGLIEADLNLRVVKATLIELGGRDIAAASTRSADYLTTLQVRSAFADALGAQLMVSVHHNAPNALASDTPGTEVFVQSGSGASRRLGGLLHAHVKEALAMFGVVAWTSASDAGVLRVLNTEGGDAYGMIRRPATPTVLVEMGYISNPGEAELFTTGEYIEVAAAALADAIEAFLTSTAPGSGFVDEPRVFDPARAPGAEVCVDPPLE